MKQFQTEIVKTFRRGDFICCAQNLDNGMPLFFKATEHDVKFYSGYNTYYRLIPTKTLNPSETKPLSNYLVERLDNFVKALELTPTMPFVTNKRQIADFRIITNYLKNNSEEKGSVRDLTEVQNFIDYINKNVPELTVQIYLAAIGFKSQVIDEVLANGEKPEVVNPVGQVNLIRELQKVVGAKDYSGEASFQVILPTINNEWLRIGITDSDVGTGKLWFDYYEGFNNELLNNKPRTTDKEEPLIELLREILKHNVANLGTSGEFHRCFTYENGKMPDWVQKVKNILKVYDTV